MTSWRWICNHLMTAWWPLTWQSVNCLTTTWQLPDDYLMIACQKFDNSLATAWWQTDYCLMMAWKLPVTVYQLLEERKTAWRLSWWLVWRVPGNYLMCDDCDNWLGNAKLPDNGQTTTWWLPDDCMTTTWCISDDYLTSTWQLPDNCLTNARWLPDDCLTTAWWLPDN